MEGKYLLLFELGEKELGEKGSLLMFWNWVQFCILLEKFLDYKKIRCNLYFFASKVAASPPNKHISHMKTLTTPAGFLRMLSNSVARIFA